MALSCRAGRRQPRQLSGVKRTPHLDRVAAAFDPWATNFVIWSTVVVLVLNRFSFLDR